MQCPKCSQEMSFLEPNQQWWCNGCLAACSDSAEGTAIVGTGSVVGRVNSYATSEPRDTEYQSAKTDLGMDVWSFIGFHIMELGAVALGLILILLGWTKTGIGFVFFGAFFMIVVPVLMGLVMWAFGMNEQG